MKKIAFAWGGTWWHITPLVSIKNKLWSWEFEYFWIWEDSSLEQKISNENSIRFYSIKAWKLRRYFSLKTFIEPFNIIRWIKESIKILKNEKPDLIFSKWWYVSLPVAIAAKFLWIRLFMHESDTIPWLANRIVWRFASRIYLWFASASKYFDKWKTKVVWQILNPILFSEKETSVTNHKTNLLVIAWSQWSTRIFKMILDNIDKFSDFNMYIVLWSLNAYLKTEFDKFQNISSYEFINQSELSKLMQIADIAITRAWATSLAELDAFWIKQIIIPLKESANNHQFFNALDYKANNEAEMIIEEKLWYIPHMLKNYINFKKKPKINKIINALDVISDDIKSIN